MLISQWKAGRKSWGGWIGAFNRIVSRMDINNHLVTIVLSILFGVHYGLP
jgi:hypothetical protein